MVSKKVKVPRDGRLVRERIASILFFNGPSYGYVVGKIYNQIFPQITLRNIYYHLKKGVSLGMFVVKEAKQEEGNYSWGELSEKVYYDLSPTYSVDPDPRVAEFFRKKKGQNE